MGLGKTFVAVKWLEKIYSKFTFIVVQKNKVQDWKNECLEFFDNNDIVVPKTGKDLKQFVLENSHNKFICITTYDKFRSLLKELKSHFWNWTSKFDLIIDESQVLKNHSSQISKLMLKANDMFDKMLLCSGDPLSCGYKDLFVQMKLLECFNKKYTWYHFLAHYCVTRLYNNIQIILSYKNLTSLMKLLHSVSFFMKSDEAIDLPEQNEIEIPVKTNKFFTELLRNKILLHNDSIDDAIICDNNLTLLTSLRQLQSGFVYDKDHKTINLNENKLEAFKSLIDNNNNFVVFYNFIAELEQIKNATNSLNKNFITLEEFKINENYTNTVIAVQLQSGAKGVDGLQFSFNHTIYYSLPLSGELFKQSLKRTHRLNQTNKCFYYYLLNDNKLDAKILKTLKNSQEYTQRMFEEDLENLQ